MSKIKTTDLYMLSLLILGILFSLSFLIFKLPKTSIIYDFRELIYPGVPILLFFLLTKEKPRHVLQFKVLSISNIVYIVLMTLLFIPIVGAISALTFQVFPNEVLRHNMAGLKNIPIWYGIIITALQPAILEEISFRGIVRHGYNEYDLKKQAIIVGLYFGFFHLNFNQFFYAAVFGFLMTYIFFYTRSIVATMLFHFLNNGTSLLLAHYIQATPQNTHVTTAAHIGAFIFTVCILAADGALFRLVYKSFVKYNQRINNSPDYDGVTEYAVPEQNAEKYKLFTPVFFVITAIFVFFASFVQIYDTVIK